MELELTSVFLRLGDQSPRPPEVYRIEPKAKFGCVRSKERMAARLRFRSWHGARVGPHRSPILRPRSFSLRFVVISSTPLKLNVQLGQNMVRRVKM